MDVINYRNTANKNAIEFVKIMKNKCKRDIGTNPIINRAVVAVATAMIHHHGLGNQAIDLVAGKKTISRIVKIMDSITTNKNDFSYKSTK